MLADRRYSTAQRTLITYETQELAAKGFERRLGSQGVMGWVPCLTLRLGCATFDPRFQNQVELAIEVAGVKRMRRSEKQLAAAAKGWANSTMGKARSFSPAG